MLHKNIEGNIQLILGNLKDINSGPYEIFDEIVINFLNEISKEIFQTKKTIKFTDIISFGFWCRSSNIKKILNNYSSFTNRIGRGSVLHITPTNVPTTFAYSLAFGLLAGNHNLIRIPSKNFFQVKILCDIFSKLLKKRKFKSILRRITLIKYKSSDKVSMQLSKIVEARVIWGGDDTIKKFKSFETNPRCIDLTFADRFSASLINSKKLLKLKKNEFKKLANNFYNDAYTMDQFGCSSPIILFWTGKEKEIKKKFWLEVQNIVNKNYKNDLSSTNKKISNLTFYALKEKGKFNLSFKDFNLIRLKKNDNNFQNFQNISFGTFYEIDLKNLDSLKNFTSNKLQTITYHGYNFNRLKKIIVKNKIKGIDRFVPIGRAFDLTPEWDGVDIILTLSRTISS